MSLAYIQALIDDLARDQGEVLSTDSRTRALEAARLQYSADRPRVLVEDIAWASGNLAPVPSSWTESVWIKSAEYPIGPKEHGVEFLMDNRHLWLRSNRQWAILRVRATIIKAMRDWLDDNGFILVDTPILTPSAAEGTTTLFQTDFHGEPAFLAQTGQLYNEANIFAVGKTYCFGPTFRAEKSKTRRHLQEFWMVEPEIAFCKLEDLLEIEEQYVSYIVQITLAERANELKLLERDTTALAKVIAPFPRIS
ncbi:MAG: hypothetical protein CVU23_10575, partial [Betaproteobacteria bacterium HGW-Betaproteobacteria-17]